MKIGSRVRVKLGDVEGWVTIMPPSEREGVRVGFDFPRAVEIKREELLEQAEYRNWREGLGEV